ncbi:MAG: hypothetical protein QXI19_07425 [Candidatus Caldarchaeum sp.]
MERCILCGEEYLRTPQNEFTPSCLDSLSNEDLKHILPIVLKEEGRCIYECDKGEQEGVFYLEAQKFQERVWRAISWRLIACTIPLRVVDEDDVLRFSSLVVSDEAEGGVIIAKGFTASALRAAESTGVELVDGMELAGLLAVASSSSPFCPSCLQIPQGVRESLLRLKRAVKSLRNSSNTATAKWSSPLQGEMLLREMVIRASSIYRDKGVPETLETKLREELDALCNELESIANRIERLDGLLARIPTPHDRTKP